MSITYSVRKARPFLRAVNNTGISYFRDDSRLMDDRSCRRLGPDFRPGKRTKFRFEQLFLLADQIAITRHTMCRQERTD